MSMNMTMCLSAADRISSLPCSAQERILDRLPLREAIRSSVLSREWRYKWVVRSELVFDDLVDIGGLDKIVCQVLQFHQGPLRKFSLRILSYELFPRIDQWILYLLKKNVHEFSLVVFGSNNFNLPSHLFNFQDLRHLKLYNCNFHPPPNFKAFSRLTTLTFSSVRFNPTSFPAFLSSSLLLERVRLANCTPLNSFIVDAPSLKFFEFSGVAGSICLKNTPMLEELSVSNNGNKSFTVGLPEPPVILHNVKLLKFSNFYFNSIEWVARILPLINNCPNLERLEIQQRHVDTFEVRPAVKHLYQSQGTAVLKQLKSVDIHMEIEEAHMEFLKYVLSSATKLRRVCIWTRYTYMMEVVKRFPRSSPNVEFVLIHDNS